VLSELLHNTVLLISASAWAITQVIKVLVILVHQKRLDWSFFIGSGGMPSSHTSTVCALATAIAMSEGMGSIYFSLSAVLAVIVMYDSAGVRQSVGKHSEILNRIVREFTFKTTRPEREKDLQEFIGHTPFQVFVGAILGVLIAWIWMIIIG
jgi:acid phosphatase family membrane protein YuiD